MFNNTPVKSIITILFWAALLAAFSVHGAKASNTNNQTEKSVVDGGNNLAKP